MNTEELAWLMTGYEPIFKGVFPRDGLPNRNALSYPACCIANYDPKGKPGTHWVAFLLTGKDNGQDEYYDSYGLPPLVEEFNDFLGKKYLYNDVMVQSLEAKTCGLHAVHFLQRRMSGESMKKIVTSFDPDGLLKNDLLVVNALSSVEPAELPPQMENDFVQTCLPLYPGWFA